ncbi:MAG: sulfotransferase family protein [Flavobacteriaceae bacterium]|nr:sulfotransferase family protein [Flavobacteriaceae bacterium]
MKIKTNLNLIFLHIPKNGGMTLHSILERIYPPEQTFSIKVIDNTSLNTTDFINLPLSEREKIKLLKGHMLFGLHQYLVGESKYITFLRKPEDRLRSFYYYVKKRPHHRLYNKIFGKGLSFHEFIEEINTGDIHNAQVRWISGLEHGSEQEMLETALKNINTHFSFVGLLEQFDASLLLLSKIYGWGIPHYKQQNKGSYVLAKEPIAQETLDLITKKNDADMKLYSLIEEDFILNKRKVKFLNAKLQMLKYTSQFQSSYKINKLKKLLG